MAWRVSLEPQPAMTGTLPADVSTQAETTLGPMVRTAAADFARGQIADATRQGAQALIEERAFPESRSGTPYLAAVAKNGIELRVKARVFI